MISSNLYFGEDIEMNSVHIKIYAVNANVTLYQINHHNLQELFGNLGGFL